MENQKLLSASGQCSSTLISIDLVPVNFYVFPRLKSALEGWRLCDTTDIIKNAMEELKMLSQYGF
jgi:hypothetical protein